MHQCRTHVSEQHNKATISMLWTKYHSSWNTSVVSLLSPDSVINVHDDRSLVVRQVASPLTTSLAPLSNMEVERAQMRGWDCQELAGNLLFSWSQLSSTLVELGYETRWQKWEKVPSWVCVPATHWQKPTRYAASPNTGPKTLQIYYSKDSFYNHGENLDNCKLSSRHKS